MNIAYEFSKVKLAFNKVKTDMDLITEKIHENYNQFLKDHLEMQEEIKKLSNEVKTNLEHFRTNHLQNLDNVSKKEILEIKKEMKDLKEEISHTFHKSLEFNNMLNLIKENQISIKDLKEKVHSNELEIYLLKERLLEKDLELAKMKDTNKHMLDIIDELSAAELELLNKKA